MCFQYIINLPFILIILTKEKAAIVWFQSRSPDGVLWAVWLRECVVGPAEDEGIWWDLSHDDVTQLWVAVELSNFIDELQVKNQLWIDLTVAKGLVYTIGVLKDNNGRLLNICNIFDSAFNPLPLLLFLVLLFSV